MRISLFSPLLAAFLMSTTVAFADGITIGEEFKGEVLKALGKKEAILPGIPEGRFGRQQFVKAVPVELKSGQSIAVSLILTGDTRAGGLSLVDSSNTLIKSSMTAKKGITGSGGLAEKTSRIEVKEIPATGTYTIYVVSNQAGEFTLFVKDLNKKRDAKAIQAELEEARKKVTELEKELKGLEKKE